VWGVCSLDAVWHWTRWALEMKHIKTLVSERGSRPAAHSALGGQALGGVEGDLSHGEAQDASRRGGQGPERGKQTDQGAADGTRLNQPAAPSPVHTPPACPPRVCTHGSPCPAHMDAHTDINTPARTDAHTALGGGTRMHTHTPGQTPPPKDAAGDAAGEVGVEGQGQGVRKTMLWLDFCARAVSSAAVAGSLGGGREEGETGEGAALSQGLAGEERACADAGAVLEETGERGGGVCAHWLRSDKVQEEVRASRTYMDNLGNVTTTTLPYTPGGCFCTCWHGGWCIPWVPSCKQSLPSSGPIRSGAW